MVVGFTEGRIPSVTANRLLLRNISVVGAAWGAWFDADPSLFAQTDQALRPMIAGGSLAPIVGATCALDDSAAALRLIDERRALGKVVVTI